MKNFFASKINWSGILLILMALLPIIENQNFDGMKAKDWITFGIGILIIVFRTYFTSTQIGSKPANPPTP
ncbi:MAG TPA: hypothetical protein VJ455_01980 [Ignavibacteria bacterium]|nr:hypothetical protein [Ignavibacteria bacterium]